MKLRRIAMGVAAAGVLAATAAAASELSVRLTSQGLSDLHADRRLDDDVLILLQDASKKVLAGHIDTEAQGDGTSVDDRRGGRRRFARRVLLGRGGRRETEHEGEECERFGEGAGEHRDLCFPSIAVA